MEKKKTIVVSKWVWHKLTQMKLYHGCKTMNELMTYLIDKEDTPYVGK